MNKELKVEKDIKIDATTSKVWDALINPEIVKKYFFGTELLCDWMVGSEIVFQGEMEGKSYRDHGRILDIVNEKLIRYSYYSGFSGLEDRPENYSLVTYTLQPDDGHTLLYLVQEGFANDEAKEHAVKGWDMVLDNLKRLLEATV